MEALSELHKCGVKPYIFMGSRFHLMGMIVMTQGSDFPSSGEESVGTNNLGHLLERSNTRGVHHARASLF